MNLAGPRAEIHSAAVPGVLRALVLFHEDQALGAGTSVLRVVPELAAYGWSVSGWVPGRGPLLDEAGERLETVASAERPLAVSLRGWREAPGVRARARATPAYVRALRATLLRVRPNVVHANTLLSLPEAAIARSYGIPVVTQVHEIPPPGLKRSSTVRLAARVSDVLVGVSDAVSEMLRPLAGRTPVLTVRNGVPLAVAPGSRGKRPFTVGTIGTVSRIKGTDVFAHAAAIACRQRPGMRFEHVGAPDLHRDPGLDEEISRLLTELPRGALVMRGALPAQEVLPRWDAFVLPSRSEAFPLATLEAMSAGLPVVASTVGGIPEQIEHLVSGVLVPPGDADALASWLVRLHDDSDLRRRLGTTAAERARTSFTLRAQAEGLHRAYVTALDLRFGPSVVRRALRAAT